MNKLSIRELRTFEAFKQTEALEQEVWGLEPSELVPAAHIAAAVHAGGLLAMAFEGETPVAFVYGFPAHMPAWEKPHGHHSHMLAVLPDYRGKGLGKALKWFQRDWCLARGITWMTWTYDPLQARNARLNLEHLGASVAEYRVNEYGAMGGILNADLPTDRLLAYWNLSAKRVRNLAGGEPLPLVKSFAATVLSRSATGKPENLSLEGKADGLRLELPENLNALLQTDPALALKWRLAVRETLQHYLERGYKVTRFVEGAYLLKK